MNGGELALMLNTVSILLWIGIAYVIYIAVKKHNYLGGIAAVLMGVGSFLHLRLWSRIGSLLIISGIILSIVEFLMWLKKRKKRSEVI